MPKAKKSKKEEAPKKTQISGDMTFTEVLQKKPRSVEVFFKYGMHCFGCMAATFENVEDGCRAHGLDAEKVIKEINELED